MHKSTRHIYNYRTSHKLLLKHRVSVFCDLFIMINIYLLYDIIPLLTCFYCSYGDIFHIFTRLHVTIGLENNAQIYKY